MKSTLRATVEFLGRQLDMMPLNRWNESVFRFHFSRCLAENYPDVEQFVECGRIDLVLRWKSAQAFVEFKFYLRRRRFDPYDLAPRGFKGGPGQQNLREFRACVDQLNDRPNAPGLSKYVVLVYADPDAGPNLTFSESYDDYQHSDKGVPVELVESCGPIETTEGNLKARLYRIGVAAPSSR